MGEFQVVEEGEPPSMNNCHDHEADGEITISSTSKLAGQQVAPFLAQHIPKAYAPLGLRSDVPKDPNTKYCYRHQPDAKCRRTADEQSMDYLQRQLERLSQSDQQGIAHVWSLFSAAPSKQRSLMLQGILTQCCFPQLSYLSAAVRDLIRIDFLTALPSEIAFKILCYLDTASLCKAARVCQKWRALADDDVVWHKMCEQHIHRKCTKCGWGLPLLERKRLRDWKRQQQLRATARGLNEWSPNLSPPHDAAIADVPQQTTPGVKRAASESAIDQDDDAAVIRKRSKGDHSYFDRPKFRPWKDVYKDRFKVGTNWRYGRCQIKVFRGHENGVMCLQFDENILATGSYDSTIKIWDIESGECLRTLRGHTAGIRALQFDDTKLISGSLDTELKLWNWRTGECLKTFSGHTAGIIGLHFDDDILASGSIDKSIKVWNFREQQCFSLRGHKDWINAVKVDSASRTLFSTSDDCTIRLWDLDTKKTLRIFEGHVGPIQQVVVLPGDYEPDDSMLGDHDDDASSSGGGSSSTPPSAEMLTSHVGGSTTDTFADWPTTRPRPARYMITGALDDTIRLWDVATGRCRKTFFGHVEGVWALAADTLRVVSGAQDRMVKVWDARTGKCERTFTGHAGPVTCLGLSDARMATGGEDAEVRLYSFGNVVEGEAAREL